MKTILLMLLMLGLHTDGVRAEAFEKICRKSWCYYVETVEGWTVYYSEGLATGGAAHLSKVRKRLRDDLMNIRQLVTAEKIEILQNVPIYMSAFDPSGFYTLGVYHHSRELLAERGHDPEKVQAIEIANTENYLRNEKSMPAAVLHELAHAFRKKIVLGPQDVRLQAIYAAAGKGGKYDNVPHFDGSKTSFRRAYALTDRSEYFCESVEAFFWRNDFFPFDRKDLKSVDPEMHDFLSEVWNESSGKLSRR